VLGPCPLANHSAALHLFARADARAEGKKDARTAPGFGQIARFARNFGYANRYLKLLPRLAVFLARTSCPRYR
jgi:hypothetical protein